MARITRAQVAALAAGALLAASGCGDSGRTAPLTRAELTQRANVICRRVVSKVDWGKVSATELPRLVSKLAALEESAADELDKLTPPTSIADEWRLVVDGFRLTGPEFKQIAEQVKSGGPGIYRGFLPLSNAQHERGIAANNLHIKECARY